jgi:NAD(P)-dependent dehydrogenase (short-subunit alcohol dehydrogenase family)
VRQKVEQMTVSKKPAQPEDFANAVAYLASEENRYMTGAVITMLGGLALFVF